MKGQIRRLISGVVASKSARNNPPTTGNAEDEKGDLDKSSASNFEQKCKYKYISKDSTARDKCFVLHQFMSCDTVYPKNSKGFVSLKYCGLF